MRTILGRPAWLLILIPLLVLSILPEAPARASSAAQDVEMEVIPVQGNVYMLQTPPVRPRSRANPFAIRKRTQNR